MIYCIVLFDAFYMAMVWPFPMTALKTNWIEFMNWQNTGKILTKNVLWFPCHNAHTDPHAFTYKCSQPCLSLWLGNIEFVLIHKNHLPEYKKEDRFVGNVLLSLARHLSSALDTHSFRENRCVYNAQFAHTPARRFSYMHRTDKSQTVTEQCSVHWVNVDREYEFCKQFSRISFVYIVNKTFKAVSVQRMKRLELVWQAKSSDMNVWPFCHPRLPCNSQN